jgi:hypothetical protein
MTNLKTVAEDFSVFMCSHFGATILPKEDAVEMKAIAWGMDLGRGFGATGLASGASFMSDYTTTLGTNIYMPKSHREDYADFIAILTHECQHVLQFKESGVEFAWLYLAEPEARARYEADAYAAGLALAKWMHGSLPADPISGIVAGLVRGYSLRQADAELAEDMLKSHFVSLKNDMIMSKSAREAIKFLDANYPELRGTL